MFASASDDNTVKLWNRQGRLLQTLDKHTDRVKSVSFSPDGQRIASASWDGTVNLWDRMGNLIDTLNHEGQVTTAQFSPDGELITGSSDGIVTVWIPKGPSFERWQKEDELSQPITVHRDRITDIDFNSDGQMVVVSENNLLSIWNRVDVNGKIVDFENQLTQTIPNVLGASFAVSTSQKHRLALMGGGDNKIRLWNLEGMGFPMLAEHKGSIVGAKFSPNGRELASAGSSRRTPEGFEKGETIIWTLDGNSATPLANQNDNSVVDFEFSPDGQYLAVAENSIDISPNQYQSQTSSENAKQHQIRFLPMAEVESEDEKLLLETSQEISSFSFSPDSQFIAVGMDYISRTQASSTPEPTGEIMIWNLNTNQELIRFPAHEDRIISVQFSPDSQLVASSSWDNTVKVWQLNA